jgi:hypothetical protein
MVSHLKSKPEPGPGNRRASVDAAARREAMSPPPSPLTADQAVMRDTLMREHPGLHETVATASVRGAERVQGPGGAGADVVLLSGGGREVSVHSGAFTAAQIGSHLQEEARQRGTTEIYLQIGPEGTEGLKREDLLKMIPGIRAGYPELEGLDIKFFGPDGAAWWEGPFRGPKQ